MLLIQRTALFALLACAACGDPEAQAQTLGGVIRQVWNSSTPMRGVSVINVTGSGVSAAQSGGVATLTFSGGGGGGGPLDAGTVTNAVIADAGVGWSKESNLVNRASGTATTISAGATTTLATFSRSAGEMLFCSVFGTDHVAGVEYVCGGAIRGTDGVSVDFEETSNSNEVNVRARNWSGVSNRTIDWAVTGVVP
jgi:hypothetical protein